MNLKTSSTCLLILLLASQLAACATASPTPEIITATPLSTLTLTATPVPSETPTPLPTGTNTPSPTPERLAPYCAISDFSRFDYTEQFWGSREYTKDEYLQILQEPSSQEIDVNVTPIRFYGADTTGDTTAIHIEGIPNVNMFVQHCVLVKTEYGTYHIAHWKVVYFDTELGKNVIRDLSTAMEYGHIDNLEVKVFAMKQISTMKLLQFGLQIRGRINNDPARRSYNELLTENPLRDAFLHQIITEKTGSEFIHLTRLG